MIKISKRLESLSKYVSLLDRVIDVGCDHALLDIYLVESGKQDKVYVCDVNPNALLNGKENIKKYDLESKIFPILSYGIEKINELPVDTVIISGMGAKNIIDILSSPNLDRVFKVILQSNTNHADIRKFLMDAKFEITFEEIIEDGKKTYINIVAIKGSEKKYYNEKEIEFGPILINNRENLNFFNNLRMSLEKIYYSSKDNSVKVKMGYLDEIIENLKSL